MVDRPRCLKGGAALVWAPHLRQCANLRTCSVLIIANTIGSARSLRTIGYSGPIPNLQVPHYVLRLS